MGFWTTHWIEILFGLVAAGALAFCKYLGKQLKNYKSLIEKQDDEHLLLVIDKRLEPIKQDLEDLKDLIADTVHDEEELKNSLVSSYRFRLMQLCKIYIRQKYMTQEQYD